VTRDEDGVQPRAIAHDADALDRREAVAPQRAQEPVLLVREPVVDLLERVEPAASLDETDDVAADPVVDDGQERWIPLLERRPPGQVEELMTPCVGDELDTHA